MQGNGQCHFKAQEGKKMCPVHAGSMSATREAATALKNYNLTKYQARVGELANSNGVKSLRDEIGILRMMLESKLNGIQDDMSLMIESHQISDMILKIEKLVVSCHKLEQNMGALLDKSSILSLAAKIVTIIGEMVPERATEISNAILAAITEDDNEHVG
jgi:hypothetical protein